MGCNSAMVANYKIVIANHLLDTARAVKDHEVARHFVQRAINAMVDPTHRDFKRIGTTVRNPVHGMAGKGVVSHLGSLKFTQAARASRAAHASAKAALAARTLTELRRHAAASRKHLDAALRSSVPAAIKATES